MTNDELNAAVAVEVMGYRWYRHVALTHEVVLAKPSAYFDDPNVFVPATDSRPGDERDSGSAPPYATDIAHAWSVVEKMRAEGYGVSIESIGTDPDWWCFISTGVDAFGKSGEHANPARAICLAALSAVRAKTQDPK